MPRLAAFPPLDDGPRTPWPRTVLPALEKFILGLPFEPSGFRLRYEGPLSPLEGVMVLPVFRAGEAGTLALLPGWQLGFKRGRIPERDVDWLVLEGPCNKSFLRVLARLLEDLKPVDRRDLSLTVWR